MNVETSTQTEAPMPQVNAEAAAKTAEPRAATANLAPPFYSPWRWIRPYAPAGFWTAHPHNDHTGELVLQLGRDGGSGPATVANSYLRWEPGSGRKLYIVRFDPISLSRRPHYGVNLRAFVQVNSYKATRELYGGTQWMGIQAYGRHIFRVGYEVALQANGTYGEVIGKISDVDQQDFYASRSAAEAFDGEPGAEEIQQLIESADGAKVEVITLGSLKEVALAGRP